MLWVNNTGTTMIAIRPLPGQSSTDGGTVLGIQTPAKFTPLPTKIQRLIMRQQVFLRLPAW